MSLCSDGNGKPYYFDWKLRKKILSGKIKLESADSHTSIADYYGFKGAEEDKLNKWEYNPITKVLTQDAKGQCDNDHDKIYEFCKELDFKTIVPQLNIHPIVHPFKDFSVTEVSDGDLKLLKEWDSVRDSVRDPVRDSVRDPVRDSVWASVGDSVWVSVGDSVWDSVRASVWASVGDSVGDSVGASVRAYIGTYFDIKYKVNIKPSNELWNKGMVPSFDGALWRLHGKNGKIIWSGEIKDIK